MEQIQSVSIRKGCKKRKFLDLGLKARNQVSCSGEKRFVKLAKIQSLKHFFLVFQSNQNPNTGKKIENFSNSKPSTAEKLPNKKGLARQT